MKGGKKEPAKFKVKKTVGSSEAAATSSGRPKMIDPLQIVSDILNYKKLPQMESKRHKAINSFEGNEY